MVKLFGFLLGGSLTVVLIVMVVLNLGPTSGSTNKIVSEEFLSNSVQLAANQALDIGERVIDKVATTFEEEQDVIPFQASQTVNEMDSPSLSMEKRTENTELQTPKSTGPDDDTPIAVYQFNEWQGFWVFSNQYSAEHFAKHLGMVTNLEIKAFPTERKDFVIAFAYTSEAERMRAQQYLETKGSIKLNRNIPEFVSVR